MLGLCSKIKFWWGDDRGLAAVEAALIFPVMLTLLLGVFDLGNGILANQKTIRASQVPADLIARNRSVDAAMVSEAVSAGRLAFEPMSSAGYGYDIVSIRFDDDANPQIVWRETDGMSQMANVLADVMPLAEAGNGVLVVGVEYEFRPVFAGFVIDNIPMQEIAFARGRKSPVVTYE